MKWHDQGNVTQVSGYCIAAHPDYQFSIGDVVIRLTEPNTSPSAAAAAASSSAVAQNPGNPWIGEIIDIYDGQLLVYWSSGIKSLVSANEVFVVEGYSFHINSSSYKNALHYLTISTCHFCSDDESTESESEIKEKQSHVNSTDLGTSSSDSESSSGSHDTEDESCAASHTSSKALSLMKSPQNFARPRASHLDRLGRRGSFMSDSKRSEDDDSETSQSYSYSFETASERAFQIQEIKRRMEKLHLIAVEDDDDEDPPSEALAKSEEDDDVEDEGVRDI